MSYLIMSAAAFAAEAHKDQRRKELPDPYINHPLRVAKMAAKLGLPETHVAAALLHDVVEDTPTPLSLIESLFPKETFNLVVALTKWWDGKHPSEAIFSNKGIYYNRIIATDGAAVLKVLDRIDNLYDFARIAKMSPSSHEVAARYLRKTNDEFGPLIEFIKDDYPEAVRWFNSAMNTLEDAL